MVTWANLIEFEHGVPKLTVAPPSAVVFGAGDALIANMLTERVVRAGTVHTVTDLANALSTQYAQMRQERAEADILMARGLNWAAFYGQHAQLQQPIVMMIDQALAESDPKKVDDLWHQADVKTMADAPWVPITTGKYPYYYGTRVANWVYFPFANNADITNVYLKS